MKQKRILPKIIACLMFFVVMASNLYAAQVVDLKSAGNYTIFASSGISSTGTPSIVGNIGVSQAVTSTAITGFGLILDGSGKFAKSSLVTGKVYAYDYSDPTPAVITTAESDMEAAYTDAAGQAGLPVYPEVGNPVPGTIGGMTLTPGIYKWSTGVTIPTDLTLQGTGSPNDVWIFQIAGTLELSQGKQVILSGGAQEKNIFWQVTGTTTLYPNSVFSGIILDKTNIVLQTGATLCGRAFAQTAVTLDNNTISATCGTNHVIPVVPEFPFSAAPFLILSAVTLGVAVLERKN
jgi:hypothetical protein